MASGIIYIPFIDEIPLIKNKFFRVGFLLYKMIERMYLAFTEKLKLRRQEKEKKMKELKENLKKTKLEDNKHADDKINLSEENNDEDNPNQNEDE